ncbi:MAG TPA: anaerobic glycerol-3-phosphate dehydrogenase subunit GlpA [Candidatus Dormibacteraeota bacterium]
MPATIQTDVLVIGGGSTGSGVARDAAMRGFSTLLVERRDLADGTTGRFHGLLHSGGRYAVKDPPAAIECINENVILHKIAPDCIEDTGGLFVVTPWDDPAFGDRFVVGCRSTGVPVDEVSVDKVLREVPRLNPGIKRAFSVPDAAIDPWKLVWSNVRSAQENKARVLTYHRVLSLDVHAGRVTGAVLRDERSGQEITVHAEVVVNAAGAWAGQIAAMAGCEVAMLPGKGVMIAMNHRLVQTVLSRCKMPGDGDIIVPIRTTCVIGTTDVHITDPDQAEITTNEVEFMLDEGDKLVPGFRQARALHAWAGVRPLFQETHAKDIDTRDVTRSHALLDHKKRDGLSGLITITGGKTTTYRLMAEVAVDSVCEQLGAQRPCRTAEEVLPGSERRTTYQLGARLEAREPVPQSEEIICECELVTRPQLDAAIARRETDSVDDIRRLLRVGMGPCQGGFCIYRATGLLHSDRRLDYATANRALLDFLEERWKGLHPILYGAQLRQTRLDDWIFQGLLDVPHLPK